MLCKTTMRAALAHVLAAVGIVGAFGAGAAPDNPYATESLSGNAPYSVKATVGEILLDAEVDTLLEGGNNYYLVVNFWSATLTEQLAEQYTATQADVAGIAGDMTQDPPVVAKQPEAGHGTGFRFYTISKSTPGTADTAGSAGAVTPQATVGSPGGSIVTDTQFDRASRGDEGDHSGMYRIELPEGTDIPIDARVRLELGQGTLAIPGPGTYYVDLYIYEDPQDARLATRAEAPGDAPNNHLVHEQQKLFEVKSKIAKPKVEAMLATADVAYERQADVDDKGTVLLSDGGPFRGFVAPDPNVGVLAMITLEKTKDVLLHVASGEEYTDDPNTGAMVVVKAAAGAFGFGDGAGTNLPGPRGEAPIMGDNPATPAVETDHRIHSGGPPTAFRIATSPECKGGSELTLMAPNAEGKLAAIDPRAEMNPTYSAQATQGSATVTVNGDSKMFYFCVTVGKNEVAIPEVGNDRDMDGYKITVTPMNGTTKSSMVAMDQNGGSITRNGTTVNITYLSAHPAYNQRLVIVNRGTREAEFWMDEFQTESDTMVMSELRGEVGPKSRMVIRVQDELMVNEGGMSRASGTLNLTAPESDIDIMTLQVHPGTGQIDTTIYATND